ncbi:MAG: xanthine dehydrogenase family protein molybdopterin-binding subunit [Actinomycetota bacterium]
MGFLGNAVKRLEDPRILQGGTCYSEDVRLPGQLYAAFVRSTEAHAEIRGVDAEEARGMPGVVGVWTAADLDPLPLCPTAGGYMPVPGMEQPVLATGRVRHVGEAVAVVLTESRYQAADAAGAVFVDYEPLPAIVDPVAALETEAPLLFPDWGSNLILDTAEEPLPDDFFADADIVLEVENRNQRVASASLEPRSVCVGPHPDTGEFTMWTSSQHPQKTRADVCAILGIDESELRVIAPDVGGGFGAKSILYPEEILLVLLARTVGRPVTWTETRTENMLTTVHGRSQVHRLRIGAKRDGTLVALAGEVIADVGAYLNLGALLMNMTTQMAPSVYAIPNVALTAKAVLTNTAPIGAYRGAGRPEAIFSIEQAVNQVARELAMDPVEVRRKNFITGEFPYVTGTGMTYDSGDYAASLDKLLEALDYETLRKDQAARRVQNGNGKLLGVGISTYVEITGALGFGEDGSVEVLEDGRVLVKSGTSPHGQGHRTAWAQLVAEALGMDDLERIDVVFSDTKVVPSGGGTFGSRSLQFGGTAVHLSAVAVAEKIRQLASHLLEAAPGDIELVDGAAQVRGTPASRIPLAELAAAAADPARRPPEFDGEGDLSASTFFEQDGWTFPSGAHGVVVEVDPETGKVDLVRVVAVDDCGTVLNPLIVEGQVHGGLTQGLAQALWEGVVYSPEGQPLTTNFADYLIPSACEVPSYETLSVETPSPLNPLGAKGIGESGTVGSIPAAVSAVLDALAPLGVHHLEMPLSPEKIWRAIEEAKSTGAGEA